MRGRRYGKYNARKTEYNGVMYDSGREAQYANDLDIALKGGVYKKIERQIAFTFELYGKKICKYIVDFKVTHHTGEIEYIDVKGMKTPVFNLKWKMFTAYLAVHEPEAKALIVK